MKIDNEWTGLFFKCISENHTGREYECLHCGHVMGINTGLELSEKVQNHLKGNCSKPTEDVRREYPNA